MNFVGPAPGPPSAGDMAQPGASDAHKGRGYAGVAALLLIFVLAFALRAYRLDGQSLWADEGNSAALAGRPFAIIANDAAQDIHPPLYYFCLRVWTRLFGTSEIGLRSLSILWGLLLVAAVYGLGRRAGGEARGLIAALIAAVSPFGVYYAQEARMYIMAAALAGVAGYAAWRLADLAPIPGPFPLSVYGEGEGVGVRGAVRPGAAALYVVAAVAGLYTHYFFPATLLALNLVWLIFWLRGRRWPALWRWLALQALVLLLYLPWLGTGVSRLLAWPSSAPSLASVAAYAPTLQNWLPWAWRVFCLGPASWIWSAAAFLPLTIIGVLAAGRRGTWRRGLFYLLGWAAPIALMIAARLYEPARFKFLLLGSPFLALTLAEGVCIGMGAGRAGWRRIVGYAWAGIALAALLFSSGRVLARYFSDASIARDDYRGMAGYIAAVGQAGDAIILNAPGQWDIFSYYYRGPLPVYRLPAERPPNPAHLEAQLSDLLSQHSRLFVLYWATNESDPAGLMQKSLGARSYPAAGWWAGNVYFALYATPAYRADEMQTTSVGATLGGMIRLEMAARPADPTAAGDLLPLAFTWSAVGGPLADLKLFVQALDAGNHIVGQRDAPLKLTAGAADQHALLIEAGTPPGQYRLIAGVYEAQSGRRLAVTETGKDHIDLGPLQVERPARPLPAAALAPTYHLGGATFGPLRLIGYDRHELGKPRTVVAPLSAGAPLHLALYWQATTAPAGDWEYRLWLGERLWADWSPIGGGYLTGRWAAGELLRDQLDQFLPADLPAGEHRLRLEIRAPGQEKALGGVYLGEIQCR